MKKVVFVLLVWLSLLVVSQAEEVSRSETATPWAKGQIVAEVATDFEDSLFNYRVYRIFIKKVAEGYLVQEFYRDSNHKATNPFILTREQDVTKIPYAYFSGDKSELSITGDYVIWYENGQKMQQGVFVNGNKDGLWSRWYKNGQKTAEGFYKNTQLDGLWQLWNKDGSKMNEIYFQDGNLEAVLSGVSEESNSLVRDIKNNKSIWMEWDDKGYLRSQVILEQGKKQGLWISWDDKGRKEMLGYYSDDKREGVWQTFWLDGNETKKSEGLYRKGKKEGWWTYWNQQGEQLKEVYYEHGKAVTEK